MKTTEKTIITIEAKINAGVEKVWEMWTDPKHIIHWNYASDDWHTPRAENDLRIGGRFLSRMEARDGSNGFEFSGKYNNIQYCKFIEYILDDDRKVQVLFEPEGNVTKVTETFEAEHSNSIELQQTGWQAILDNFKKYVESDKLEMIHFEISINASREIVFNTMLDEKTYPLWTSEFNPTSHFQGKWVKGTKMLFLGTDQEGKIGGMVSRIKDYIPNRFISIEHYGIIQNGEEILSGPEVEKWAGGLENYTFTFENNETLVSVDVDTNQEFKSYFNETWPKALEKLKLICETKS